MKTGRRPVSFVIIQERKSNRILRGKRDEMRKLFASRKTI